MTEEEKNEDSGGVWTSYSDLFMSVSIVFIVMFIFSILQSSISIVRSKEAQKETEKYAESLVPESVREKNENDRLKAQNTLNDLDTNSEEVKLSLKKLSELTESITKRQDFINKLLDDQAKKDAMLAVSRDKVVKNKEQVAKLEKNLIQKDSELIELQEKMVELNIDLDSKVKKAKVVNKKLDLATEKSEFYRENYNSVSSELDMKLKEISELEKKKNELQLIQNSLQEQNSKFSNDLNYKDRKLSEKKQELDQLAEDLGELTKSYRRQTSKAKDLEIQNKDLVKYKKDYSALSENFLLKSSELKKLSTEYNNLENKMRNQDIEKERLSDQNKAYKSQIKEIEERSSGYMDENKKFKKMVNDYNVKIESQKIEIQNYKYKLKSESDKTKSYMQKVEGLQKEIVLNEGENNKLSQQVDQYNTKIKDQEKLIKHQEKILIVQKDAVEECHPDHQGKGCKEKISHLTSRINDQKIFLKKYKDQKIKGKVENGLVLSNLEAIDQILDQGIYVDFDLDDKHTVIRLNQKVIFDNNSFRLDAISKDIIRNKFVRVVNEIFKSGASRNLVEFDIVGHSSPVYQGKFTMNMEIDSKPYKYNIELSRKRAISTSEYILGQEIGNYQMKDKLRSLIKIESLGYLEPILREDQKSYGVCGKYDCEKSRRMEINVVLRNKK